MKVMSNPIADRAIAAINASKAGHFGRTGWWVTTFPERHIPDGWNRTLRSAKLDAGD